MRATIIAMMAITLAACGSTTPTPPPISNVASRAPVDAAVDAAPTGNAAVIAKMSQFKDDICKCADRACADLVMQQMSQWGQEMAKSAAEPSKMSESDTKQMAAVSVQLTSCMTKLFSSGPSSSSTP